jgi:hypothetical protein
VVFTSRYGLMPYINQITFRLLKVNSSLPITTVRLVGQLLRIREIPRSNTVQDTVYRHYGLSSFFLLPQARNDFNDDIIASLQILFHSLLTNHSIIRRKIISTTTSSLTQRIFSPYTIQYPCVDQRVMPRTLRVLGSHPSASCKL